MKVFISWSGERSKAVAELLSVWIQCVIQSVEPWVSSKDIDRGALWFSEINEQLSNVSVGIVCLTADNKDKPWILFESGALAKGLSTNRVCTLLVDLTTQDLENPLAQFNHTLPTREGLYQLIHTINNTLGDLKLKPGILDISFNTFWPEFENKLSNILNDIPSGTLPEKRPDESILNEMLNTIRSMDKRLRSLESEQFVLYKGYNGAIIENDKAVNPELTNRQRKKAFINYIRAKNIDLDQAAEEYAANFRINKTEALNELKYFDL